jgi:signal transduction histidine kinase
MRLSQFIPANLDAMLAEWEAFARSSVPPTGALSSMALRDHARGILLSTARLMESAQADAQREANSKGLGDTPIDIASSAAHGALRELDEFDLTQVTGEFRALRAAVLKRWKTTLGVIDASVLEDMMRFNESIDQALAQSIAAYSDRVDKSRDTFLAVLGHDLRGPLSSVSACLDVIAHKNSTPAQVAKATQIGKRGVATTKALIDDLLQYTRTRLGKGIEVAPKPGDLSVLCHETFDEVRAAHPARTLTSHIAPHVVSTIDAPRIRQVLSNLLDNALQHGDPGFPVELSLRERGKEVKLAVRNKGKPIPPEALQAIFNPLVQVPKDDAYPDAGPTGSLGLGLYIAREIATGHGGTITVRSSANRGTVFTVRLPYSGRLESAAMAP